MSYTQQQALPSNVGVSSSSSSYFRPMMQDNTASLSPVPSSSPYQPALFHGISPKSSIPMASQDLFSRSPVHSSSRIQHHPIPSAVTKPHNNQTLEECFTTVQNICVDSFNSP